MKPSSFFFIAIVLSCNSQTVERDIVLINVENLDRAGIADEITTINSFDPKVIAIDLQFSSHTEYDKDTRLIQAFDKCNNLIMVSIIEDYNGEDVVYTNGFTFGSLPVYLINAQTGFANTILEKDEHQTLKSFSIVENMDGFNEYHFGVRTAMAFDSLKTMAFVKDNPRIIDIDYQSGKRKFKTFSASDVFNKKVTRKDIEGKIILIGYVGPTDEDKFFSPFNKRAKPNKPDVYGLEYYAYVITQVLK